MKNFFKLTLSIIGLALLSLSGFNYCQYLESHPSTDNAYINANRIQLNSNISGQVTKITIKNNQLITKGELLFKLDNRALKIALNKAIAEMRLTKLSIQSAKDAIKVASANIAQAKAEYELDQKNSKRINSLVKDGKTSIADGDKTAAKLSVSKALLEARKSQYQQALMSLGEPGDNNAKLQQARSIIKQAKLNITYSEVRAPATGKISNLSLRVGDMVERGQTVFTIIEQGQWWLDANYKETQLQNIKVGQTAIVTLDMLPNTHLKGTVESISGGTGSTFSILPSENAAGNWVKVTQRIPVKIVLDKTNLPLALGASAKVTINTKHAS